MLGEVRLDKGRAHRARLVKGLSCTDVAARARMSKFTSLRAFRGDLIAVSTLRKIAKALDVQPADLLDPRCLPSEDGATVAARA